ncbi:MAG: hypothetical protein IGS48_10075, partial [Oscillatoriales cyanobacterium C42_A2020_001]|nr:hypothetical protein [Leptolyngbyaceae cyanobacterium C42_A2020_001]
MTSQKEQIQILITEIDSVLYRTNPRLPWVMSGEVAQQRQVLERVRNYLVALQQRMPGEEGLEPGINPAVQASFSSSQAHQDQERAALSGENPPEMSPYQMMRAILQEVSYLRANLTPPQINPALNQQQLTAELLQVLMSRLQENLSQQIAQTLGSLRGQLQPYEPNARLSGGSASALANPQYEQLQNLRSRSDQMLVNLDSTLTVVFESLQRNIQAYQEALSQGLERMYSTGQQSEYTFKLLIDQLIEQLKQEASAYLRSVQPEQSVTPLHVDLAPTESVTSPVSSAPPPAPPAPSGSTLPGLSSSVPASAASPVTPPSPAFPYAGAEFLSSEISDAAVTTPADLVEPSPSGATSLDSAIESWLQSVSEMNRNTESPEEEVFDLPELDLSTLELGELDPEVSSPTTIDFVEQGDEPDLSLDLEPTAIAPEFEIAAAPAGDLESESASLGDRLSEDEDTAEFDAALKLLEELSAELEHSTATFSLEDAEAQLDQMLSSPAVDEQVPATAELPNDARDELDEFYQSLFGSEEAAISPPAPEAIAEPEASQMPETALEAETAPELSFEASLSETLPESETLAAVEPASVPTLADSGTPATTEAPLLLDLPADLFEPESPSDAIAPSPPLEEESLPVESTLEVDEFGSLTDLFQDVSPEATCSIPIEPPGAYSNFSSVESPAESFDFFLSDDVFGGETHLETDEDQFTRAAPDESLLPNTPIDTIGASLDLDEITLNSLSEDLSSLEGAFGAGLLEFADQNIRSSPELTLEAFAQDVTQAETPEVAVSENQEAISLDDLTAAMTEVSTPAAPTPYYQASPSIADITIEGFAELFDNEAVSPTEPLSPPAIAPTEPLPFTLEGTTSLFEDPDVSSPVQPSTIQPSSSTISPFTLEGMDDLFGDAPSLPPPPAAPLTNQATVQNDASASAPFTIEGMNELFEDAPPISPSGNRTPQPESPTLPAPNSQPELPLPPTS